MQENSPIKTRILKYIDLKGISKYKFYNESGITRGILDQPNGITEDKITRFLAYAKDINLEWLFTGEGDIIKPGITAQVAEPAIEYVLRTDTRLDKQFIPLFDITAAAGLTAVFNGKQNIIDYISIPNLPKCDGAITVTGDSMYPLLKAGDIVAYKQINDLPDSILWGEMYVLSLLMENEDFVLVKYVQKSDRGDDYIKLVSQNQHHAPKDVKVRNVTAIGLIKASIRFNSMY